MLNRVVLTGRLTKDPEYKVSQNNIAVCNFNLAVNRPYTDKSGERGTDFFNIIVFRKQAETVGQSVRKGSLVGVDGRLQTRNYENKQGQRVYVTEVVADSVQFLEPKNSGQDQQQGNQQYGQGQQYGNQPNQQYQQPAQQQYGQPNQQYQQPAQQQYNQGGYNAPTQPAPTYNQGNQQQGQGQQPPISRAPYNGNGVEPNPFANANSAVINDDDLPL